MKYVNNHLMIASKTTIEIHNLIFSSNRNIIRNKRHKNLRPSLNLIY